MITFLSLPAMGSDRLLRVKEVGRHHFMSRRRSYHEQQIIWPCRVTQYRQRIFNNLSLRNIAFDVHWESSAQPVSPVGLSPSDQAGYDPARRAIPIEGFFPALWTLFRANQFERNHLGEIGFVL